MLISCFLAFGLPNRFATSANNARARAQRPNIAAVAARFHAIASSPGDSLMLVVAQRGNEREQVIPHRRLGLPRRALRALSQHFIRAP